MNSETNEAGGKYINRVESVHLGTVGESERG